MMPSDDTLVYWNSLCPVEIMQFTLTFDGKLPSKQNSGRTPYMWEIRKQIHPQLRRLWETNPVLQRLKGEGDVVLCTPIAVGGAQFSPLVRKSVRLGCELDILFLRHGEPGNLILPGGDLDNRIKILFDGLRIPGPGEMSDISGLDDPFYCLLEDDDLILRQSVRTGRLLTGGDEKHEIQNVILVIDVSVKVLRFYGFNAGFLAD